MKGITAIEKLSKKYSKSPSEFFKQGLILIGNCEFGNQILFVRMDYSLYII